MSSQLQYSAWMWSAEGMKDFESNNLEECRSWVRERLNNDLPDGFDEWGIHDRYADNLIVAGSTVIERCGDQRKAL